MKNKILDRPGAYWWILSHEHQAYWKESHRGYTTNHSEAGHYTLLEAIEIVKDANQFVQGFPGESMILDPKFIGDFTP